MPSETNGYGDRKTSVQSNKVLSTDAFLLLCIPVLMLVAAIVTISFFPRYLR